MAKLTLKNSENKTLESLDGNDRIFAEPARHHAVAEVVRYQMAKRHLGTHWAKTRSFVSRSSSKPYPQKGTGRARRGDFRSPLLEGGGTIFPPIPRSYAFGLTKKTRKAALRSVLTDKLKAEKLTVLKEHGLKEIKTKNAVALLEKLGLRKVLFVVPEQDVVLERSVRNLDGVKVIAVAGLNVYDVLNHEDLVIMEKALPILEAGL